MFRIISARTVHCTGRQVRGSFKMSCYSVLTGVANSMCVSAGRKHIESVYVVFIINIQYISTSLVYHPVGGPAAITFGLSHARSDLSKVPARLFSL